MKDTPNKTVEALQQSLSRLDHWMLTLENRISWLVGMSDPITMNDAERERAASRHYMILLRILELLKEYTQEIAQEEERADKSIESMVLSLYGDDIISFIDPKYQGLFAGQEQAPET